MLAFSSCDDSETSSGGKHMKEMMSGVKEVGYNLTRMLPLPAAIDVPRR